MDSAHDNDFLSGGGELSTLIRRFDWQRTPLGPVDRWPQSLRTTVSLMLNSQHPMWIGWGPDATFLYNDAYISVLSQVKHPWALGRPAAEVWAEIWDVCGPLADQVFHHGRASFVDDVRLFMNRAGYVEEVFYSFSYSPVRDERGEVGGLFCPSTETTDKILNARRLATLSALAGNALVEKTVAGAVAAAMTTLESNSDDVPFALLFMPDPRTQDLVLSGTANLPQAGELLLAPSTWEAGQVHHTGEAVTAKAPSQVPGLPTGLANQAVRQVRVLPVTRSAGEGPLGVLVCAISPARPLDTEYETFFSLVAGQLAATLQNAKAAEEEQERADKLAELDRAKTVFFSNVSHELRTPLALMLGPLEDLAAQNGPDAPGAAPSLPVIALRNGRRLQKLVNNLLDFARVEAGRAQARFVPEELAGLTADLASGFRSAIEKAGMRLVIDCPPLDQPVHVDRDMWEKIVLNLLSNAFKYTLEGRVTVTLRSAGNAVELQVSDTGAGIPASELPLLFNRFHRVEGARSRTHEGTGIGLALVHELVKLHGGEIQVDSTLGVGSTFQVRLPLGSAHLPALQRGDAVAQPGVSLNAQAFTEEAQGWLAHGSDPGPLTLPQGQRGTIVLADDNADMRSYIGRVLAEDGYEVRPVADGVQALAEARACDADLVLTDVMMPRLDGFGLLKALRDDPSLASVPLIMLSARAGEEARVEGLNAGADDYLVKPFTARELVARVTATIAVARERRRAIERENDLRAETVNILESIREGFVALDAQWRFTYVNAEAERLNGRLRADLLGRVHWEVYPVSPDTELYRQLHRVMHERVPIYFENHYAPWDRWFEISAYPVHDDGIALYYRDITDRKRTEQAAREADRRKDEFLATLAHELRNPLAPLKTGVQLLHQLPEGPAAQRTRAIMERQIHHMERLVDDLLDVSRISRGKLELKPRRVSLREVVDTAVETSQPLIAAGQHELSVAVPPQPVWLQIDATRISQALSNLLNNAAKYTPTGGKLSLQASVDDQGLRVQVRDNGAGIAADLLPHVFDMFSQGTQTLDRAQGGLGIGLTLVQQLVRLHGGEVVAESAGLSHGSTFTVRLPLTPLHPTLVDAPALPSSLPAGRSAAMAPRRVLLVEDNVDGAQTLAHLLELLGHQVTVAHDGRAALAMYEQSHPDLLLLDIGLPLLNGYQVAEHIRASPGGAAVKIVGLSGWGAASDRARSQAAGFDLHLTKPVDMVELREALQ
ncbi:MAG: ATP-binding protein [Pseudomonadota bacterium]